MYKSICNDIKGMCIHIEILESIISPLQTNQIFCQFLPKDSSILVGLSVHLRSNPLVLKMNMLKIRGMEWLTQGQLACWRQNWEFWLPTPKLENFPPDCTPAYKKYMQERWKRCTLFLWNVVMSKVVRIPPRPWRNYYSHCKDQKNKSSKTL